VKKTNFLPGFPKTLFGSRKRSLQEQISKEREQLSAYGISDLALLFNSLLSAAFLQELNVKTSEMAQKASKGLGDGHDRLQPH
jgi:hypothetical protein